MRTFGRSPLALLLVGLLIMIVALVPRVTTSNEGGYPPPYPAPAAVAADRPVSYMPVVGRPVLDREVESWPSTAEVMSRWVPLTAGNCWKVVQAGWLDGVTCESAGLYTKTRYDASRGVRVTVEVMGEPAPTSTSTRFWAAVALVHCDDGGPCRWPEYVTLAIQNGIKPLDHWRHDSFGHISTPMGDEDWDRCCEVLFPRGIQAHAGQSYLLQIEYRPERVRYFINKQLVHELRIDIGGNPYVEVLCVAVSPGQSRTGERAHCRFGELTIEGWPTGESSRQHP